MNMDRLVGAGRNFLGKGETSLGDATGDARISEEGVVDQVSGALQQSYGVARDAVAGAIDDAPAALAAAADRGRDLTRRADDYVRRELGDNGPLYVLAGAAALLGLGLLAFTQARSAPTPAPRRRAANPATAARKPASKRTPRAKATAKA